MDDLIRRQTVIDVLALYEKELRNDRQIAIESDDEQMLFAIMNQETAIYRIERAIRHEIHTAYDVDKVNQEIFNQSENIYGEIGQCFGIKQMGVVGTYIKTSKAMDIVKAGGYNG